MKTNLHKLYATDKGLEKEGIWMEIDDDVKFLVKRFGGNNGPSIKEAHARYMKPHARRIEAGTMPAKKEQELLIKFFVDACLIDWQGIEVDGKDTPFSREVAYELFKELPDLLAALMDEANNIENFKQQDLESVGNS